MGLQMPNLHTSMGIKKIQHMINYGCKERLTGGMLRMTYRQLAIKMGLPGEVLHHDYDAYGKAYATKNWIHTAWEFATKQKIQITTGLQITRTRREGDRYLMEIFYEIGYRKGQLAALNRCWLFLYVLTLADITSMCGKYMIKDVREGIANLEITDERYKWPEQGNPSKNYWVEWKEVMKQLCTGYAW